MAEKKQRELTPFEQELKKAITKVREYKTIAEANIISLFWKNQELMYSYSNIKREDLSENMWKVYWQVAHDIVVKERKVLDEITVNFYLEKHPKLRVKFDEYGGYDKIIDTGQYVKEESIEGYVHELQKWNVVLNMLKNKFPVTDRISEFVDMGVEQIYDEYSIILNHIFASAEGEAKSYNLGDGIYELIDELEEGLALGLPYESLPLYTKETGGVYLGGIHLIGGLSNVGKSSFLRNTLIPSCLKHGEPVLVMLNEDGLKKWQREFLVWTANNIFKVELQKYTVRDGKYPPDVKELLHKCADWIKEQDEKGIIKIIPIQKYKTSLAIKHINKYASFGFKTFVIDTFKADHDATSDNQWFVMQQAMVAINDIVKPEAKNLSIVITFQLEKGSSKQRHFTQSNIGVSKNIVDPVSTCTMIRTVLDDEYDGEKKALQVYRLDGKNGKTKIPVRLDKSKKYQILFVVKSREGSTDYQMVIEHDLSKNIVHEVGITVVPTDW